MANTTYHTGWIYSMSELTRTATSVFCRFTLIVKREYAKYPNGERNFNATVLLPFIAWEHNARYLCKNAQKNSKIYVKGHLVPIKHVEENLKYEEIITTVDELEVMTGTCNERETAHRKSVNSGVKKDEDGDFGFENDDFTPQFDV